MSDQLELHPATKRLLSRRRLLGNAGKGAAAITFLGVFTVACGDDDDDTAAAPETTVASGGDTGGADEMTLYQNLGENAGITAVVGDFLANVVADDRINAFFANVDAENLSKLVVEQIGEATGGPEVYTGRNMVDAHAGLGITMDDFNAFVEDLVAALDSNNVPQEYQDQLLGALAPMSADIVTA